MKPETSNESRARDKMLGGITGKGFMPGQSGNPSGRPKKLPITDCYATIAELPVPDYLIAALKLSDAERPAIKTYGDALALSQFRAGIKGKTDAAREIADRLESRARQPLEFAGKDGAPLDLAVRIEAGRRRLAEYREQRARDLGVNPGSDESP
jgi:hypothetical protein